MAYPYVDTPRTEAGNRTHLSAANLSFSDVQTLSSPSKKGPRDLLQQPRARNAASGLRTPRSRTTLGNLRNPAARNEFTPLLKSAAQNRFRNSTTARLQTHTEENENTTNDLVNSMLAAGHRAAPETPAYLRSARKTARRTPALPVESSVLDGEATGSSAEATPPAPAVSSSAVLSSPMSALSLRAQDSRKDTLTLRQQEVKLEKLDKENFALKLKIHFLDDMLQKTGTDYQQEIIKQNTELKVEKTTLNQDIKQQAKRLARADKELLDYKQQLHDYAEKVKKRHTNEIIKEEMDRLREAADESARLAEAREIEIDNLQHKLELAEHGSDSKAQTLRDDVADLEMDLRAKEQACEERDERIEALEDKIETFNAQQAEAQGLQEDLAEMEAELDEKDQEIVDLKAQLQSVGDREKSTRKLRYDVDELNSQLRHKIELIDEQDEELRRCRKQLQESETTHNEATRQLQLDLRDKERLLQQKTDEVISLQERLDTARGSWDAEAQQTDTRMQERNRLVQEKETELRETLEKLDACRTETEALKERLRTSEFSSSQVAEQQARLVERLTEQTTELQAKLRSVNAEFDKETDKKNELILGKEAEIRRLMAQVRDHDLNKGLKDCLVDLEQKLEESVRGRTQVEEQLRLLKDQGNNQSPSKKESLITQQTAEIARLKASCDDKECELEELEQQLTELEAVCSTQKLDLTRLQDQIARAEQDRSAVREQHAEMALLVKRLQESKEALSDEIVVLEAGADESAAELSELQRKVEQLESELSTLRSRNETATPARERGELRQRTREAESRSEKYKQQVEALQSELDGLASRADRTPMRERDSLKAQLKDANDEIKKLEHANVMLKVAGDTSGMNVTEGKELHDLLRDAKIQVENLQLQSREQDKRIASLLRKEGETRVQLGQARIDLEEGQVALAEQDARIAKLSAKEKELRSQGQQLRDRERELEEELENWRQGVTNHDRREQQLRARLRDARAELDEIKSGGAVRSVVSDKTHEKELRGLVKQIQYLRARCSREETFRRDLAFSKKWFLMQIAMYGECNQADLGLLEDMGITPDLTIRQKPRSLKAVVWMMVATQRMKKMQLAWASNKRLHESLVLKLEGMKKKRGQNQTQTNGGTGMKRVA